MKSTGKPRADDPARERRKAASDLVWPPPLEDLDAMEIVVLDDALSVADRISPWCPAEARHFVDQVSRGVEAARPSLPGATPVRHHAEPADAPIVREPQTDAITRETWRDDDNITPTAPPDAPGETGGPDLAGAGATVSTAGPVRVGQHRPLKWALIGAAAAIVGSLIMDRLAVRDALPDRAVVREDGRGATLRAFDARAQKPVEAVNAHPSLDRAPLREATPSTGARPSNIPPTERANVGTRPEAVSEHSTNRKDAAPRQLSNRPSIVRQSVQTARTPASERQAAPPLTPSSPGVSVESFDTMAVRLPSAAATPVPVPTRSTEGVTPPAAAATTESAGSRTAAVSNPDEQSVRAALTAYESAYENLDARAAQLVWPSVNARALARAFGALKSQGLEFDRCVLDVDGPSATADCRGRATYVTRFGNQNPRTEPREWNFRLEKEAQSWRIVAANTR